MISPKADAKKPCATCAHNDLDRWCKLFTDDITGQPALLVQARPFCDGDKWQAAEPSVARETKATEP